MPKRAVATHDVRPSVPMDENAPHTPAERVLSALIEAERFMAYFAGETGGQFVGAGTPESCLKQIRGALALTGNDRSAT